jgi:hypothetical protein
MGAMGNDPYACHLEEDWND